MQTEPSPEIVLHQLPPAWDGLSPSPFCTKLATYLELAGLPYRTRAANLRQAPRGKVPFVDYRGERISDSHFIIERLERDHGGLDGELTPAQRAEGHLVRRMLEEGTYFILVYFRWAKDENFAHIARQFRALVPSPLHLIVPRLVRRGVLKSLAGQGVSRYDDDQLVALARADLAALSAVLADRPFLLGDAPTSFDATAWALIAHAVGGPFRGPIFEHARALPNLIAYRDRVRERFAGCGS